MKTAEVSAALRARFCAPEWAIFFEVGDATGGRHNRWADAVAVNLYPSRGLEINGFEIKVSRGDWLRELKNPGKSDPVQRYCDRWWIVCPAGIIAPGELPPTWGHYDVQPSGKIRQIVAAPKLNATTVTRDFVAAILRRAGEIDQVSIDTLVHAKLADFRKSDEARLEREIASRTRRATELQERVEEIERISGIKLSGWCDSEEIGRAVALVMSSGAVASHRGVNSLREQADRIVKQCDKALAIFSQDMPARGETHKAAVSAGVTKS